MSDRTMQEVIFRFKGGLTITMWPEGQRAAIMFPNYETITLSLEDFAKAMRRALALRKTK